MIWGFAYVAQAIVNNYLEVNTFNFLRMFLAFLSLLPVIYIFDKIKQKQQNQANRITANIPNNTSANTNIDTNSTNIYTTSNTTHIASTNKVKNNQLIKGGFYCGLFLIVSSALQQYGIKYSTVGNAGFITSLYIVFVPVLYMLFGYKTRIITWLTIISALIGFFIISVKDFTHFEIGKGDLLLFVGAISWTAHVISINHFVKNANPLKLSCLQFLFSALLSLIPALIFELGSLRLSALIACTIPLLYTGFVSCGVAYTFQIIGQKGTNPVLAVMILSLEAVFALIAGYIMLDEELTTRMIIGCTIIGVSVLIGQLSNKEKY